MKKYISLVTFLVLGALLAQGFQCSSKEMTSAKVAIQRKDYKKAEEYLKKELELNPKNDEAMYMLAGVEQNLGELQAAAKYITDAEKIAVNPNIKTQIPIFKNQLWVHSYNTGINYFNKYYNKKEKAYLDSALTLFDVAITVKPDQPDFYDLKGRTYETKGDTAEAIEAYQHYADLLAKDLGIARRYGIFYDMPRTELLKKLEKPAQTDSVQQKSGDISLTDVFKIDGKEFFVFSEEQKPGPFKVKGWRYDPPQNWPAFERSSPSTISGAPMAALAQIFYDRKDYKNALKNIQDLLVIEPTNSQANAFMVQMYQEQGKSDEALKYIAQLTKNNPDNKFYWAQYGDICLSMNNFDEAIKQYQKALEIDPNFDVVLRNIASAYKNKAGIIQMRQQDSMVANKKYQPNFDEYFPDLKKSAEYFERCRNSAEFRNDIDVLGELINIYEVLNQKEKLMIFLADLEKLEGEATNKEHYYKIMCNVYTRLKMNDKAKTACDKFQQLMKN